MSDHLLISNVLGEPFSGPVLQDFFAQLGVDPDKSAEDGLDFFLSSPAKGFSVLVREERVVTIFLYSEGSSEGFEGFRLDLPCGLSFKTSRKVAREKLGQPFNSWDGGGKSAIFSRQPAYDLFRLDGYVLHVHYHDDFHGIAQLQLMVSDLMDFAHLPPIADSLLPEEVDNWMSKVLIVLDSTPTKQATLQQIRKLIVPSWGILELSQKAKAPPLKLTSLPYKAARDACTAINNLELCLSLRDPKDSQKKLVIPFQESPRGIAACQP